MRGILLTIAFVAVAIETAFAGSISEQRAREIASQFINATAKQRAPRTGGAATLTLAAQTEGYFAFNRPANGGFVVVASADNATQNVIGYADKGTFDPASMAPAAKWFIEACSRSMALATATTAQTDGSLEAIEPLLTTTWNQDYPYDVYCPSKEDGGNMPTGCVATAMAQIMNYHQWPAQGTGSHSYDWYLDGEYMATLSADFSQSVYNWDAMADNYDANSQEEAIDAVAKLMSDVGIAVEMDYAPYESGSSHSYAKKALVNHFGYSQGLYTALRDYYQLDEWNALLHSELADGRPIYMQGFDISGGHAFVLDGYADGFYHINWGWGGMSDGYFNLNALAPMNTGTGAANGVYNARQCVFIGMRPAQEGDGPHLEFYNTAEFDVDQPESPRNATATFNATINNSSSSMRNVTLGIKVTGSDNNALYIASTDTLNCEVDEERPYEMNIDLANLPDADGTYTVYPACRDNATGQWCDLRPTTNNTRGNLIATIVGENVSFAPSTDVVYNLEFSELTCSPGTVYASISPITITTTVTNSGTEGHFTLAALARNIDDSQIMVASTAQACDLKHGESVTMQFALNALPVAGEYEIAVATIDDHSSGSLQINVLELPMEPVTLDLYGPLTLTKVPEVGNDTLAVKANVMCTTGYFNNYIAALVYPHGTDTQLNGWQIGKLIAPNDTVEIDIHCELNGFEVGQTYDVKLYYVNDYGYWALMASPQNIATFTYGETTAIGSVAQETVAGPVDVYTLSGNRVLSGWQTDLNRTALPAGMYIVRNGKSVRKVVVGKSR